MATFVTADLHGYPLKKWEELVERAGVTAQDRLYILGDVVDRGSDGIALLTWAMAHPNVHLLKGNHEAMMLRCAFLFEGEGRFPADTVGEQRYACEHWLQNGGDTTYTALCATQESRRRYLFAYAERAPLYAQVTVGEQAFVLVHSGLGNFAPQKPLEAYEERELLWTRPSMATRYFEDRTVVFGHTPTMLYGPAYAGKPIVTETWMNIDVGAAGGNPPAIVRLEDRAVFYGR